MHEILETAYKNLHNFVQSLTDKPIGDKLLIFPDKVVYV